VAVYLFLPFCVIAKHIPANIITHAVCIMNPCRISCADNVPVNTSTGKAAMYRYGKKTTIFLKNNGNIASGATCPENKKMNVSLTDKSEFERCVQNASNATVCAKIKRINNANNNAIKAAGKAAGKKLTRTPNNTPRMKTTAVTNGMHTIFTAMSHPMSPYINGNGRNNAEDIEPFVIASPVDQ